MSRGEIWPDGLLLAYYGDDFTGSTDAMEAMAAAGVPTALFLAEPTPQALARFPGLRCVGMAGSSRSRSPEWMDTHLANAFGALARLGAPILHYKVCSTFDSSPSIGSIGRAIDIGVTKMAGRWSPTIIGAPRLKRYQAFGNLFAAVDGVAYRIDRHPTMSRHPVTPMGEADLRLHLGRQTTRPVALIDLVQLRQNQGLQLVESLQGEPDEPVPVVLIDVLDEETLEEAGRLIWAGRGNGIFSASSSGLQYALTAHWRSRGLLPAQPTLARSTAVPVIIGVSGSCSPVTAAQIAWARANGFVTERVSLPQALAPATRETEIERVVLVAIQAVQAGRSAIVFSAEGPDDDSVREFDAIAAAAGQKPLDAAREVGRVLGEVMRRLLDRTQVKRAVVAGGDSSGEVMEALGIEALTIAAGLTPGAPLCRAWSSNPRRDGLEIVLKGGQMGDSQFFGAVRAGGGPGQSVHQQLKPETT